MTAYAFLVQVFIPTKKVKGGWDGEWRSQLKIFSSEIDMERAYYKLRNSENRNKGEFVQMEWKGPLFGVLETEYVGDRQ